MKTKTVDQAKNVPSPNFDKPNQISSRLTYRSRREIKAHIECIRFS